MCGIFGAYEPGAETDAELVWASARAMRHRGPDNISAWSRPGIGLAHTRLSLVDLSAASDQPLWDESRRYVLVFNGEIYNFRELRADLASQGVSCRTTGDTEVLLHLLMRLGPREALQQLEGMFAFAFYDTAADRLVLARDRFGMKPLVYHRTEARLLFASEVKCLRPWIPLEPDLFSVSAYLSGFQGPTAGVTMFKGVRMLAPGTYMTAGPTGPPSFERFTSIAALWDTDERERLSRLRPRQVVDELESRLETSVGSQLMADAPVGVLCSGGVDSSVVVSMAAKRHSHLAIFHADVVGRHSERQAAEVLARHLKLDLLVVPVTDADFLDLLPTVLEHYERPITIRPEAIPFLRVCQLVRRHGVKGVLSGEAADECFLGYQSMMPGVESLWNWLPRLSMASVRNLYRRLALGRHAELESTREERPDLSHALASRFEVELHEAEHRALCEADGQPMSSDDRKTPNALGYHLRTLLHRNDTLGMAASIESRFPFLDTNVVRFAVNLPYVFKIRRTRRMGDLRHPFYCDKWILREVARRRIPEALSRRPKRAFMTNAFRRMRIAPAFFERSLTADLLELGPPEVAFFTASARPPLQQRLLQLEVWMRVCVCGASPDAVAEQLRTHVTIERDRT